MLHDKHFQRRMENFRCGNCGFFVVGNGFTNHCPKCLWSRHVDRNPGDRLSDCGGMMKPEEVFVRHGQNMVRHRCTLCGFERNQTIVAEDSFAEVLQLMNG